MTNIYFETSNTLLNEFEDLQELQIEYYKKQVKLKKKLKECMNHGNALKDTTKDEEIKEMNAKLKQKHSMILNPGSKFVQYFLGSVNSLVLSGSEQRRFQFKKEYEEFKQKLTIMNLPLAILLLVFLKGRVWDTFYQLFMAYFYVSLALRESILRVNGSKIHRWWIWHHYLSIAISFTFISWPPTEIYRSLRWQFMSFSIYNGCVMLLQYYYQTQRLYVMMSLGKANKMDVVSTDVTDFNLLPFLIVLSFVGHLQQALMSIRLGYILYQNTWSAEWQTYVVGILFTAVATGNIITTSAIVRRKYWNKSSRKQKKEKN
mmetsp:Transcript_10228/g.14973  ORF Transcript_10228/g.14973 Transcript_10228/m.14973 type:complete len:317 (+) Transcript_10228:52-1002(+)